MRQKIEEKSRPWMNGDGTKKSDKEISRLGQNWDMETWSRFLDEDVGVIHESDCGRMIFCKNIDQAPDTKEKDKEAQTDKFRFIDLGFVFAVALDELPRRERIMLKKLYWENKTPKETAKEMKMAPQRMHDLKYKTLAKLRHLLRSREFTWKLKTILAQAA